MMKRKRQRKGDKRMTNIKTITQESFKEYGTIIDFPEDFTEPFYIAETEKDAPWRLAVYRYKNKTIKRLECHPTSKESFEPLKGTSIILLSHHERPEEYEAFLLDRPVCLKKGVWHEVLALSEEAQVKITENLEVETNFHELSEEVTTQIGLLS